MIATVRRIVVFRPASSAEREVGHRGMGPIIGQPVDDRVAWATLGAVGERVAVAPGGRVTHFLQAIRTHKVIGRNHDRPGLSRFAGPNGEVRVIQELGIRNAGDFRLRQGRRFRVNRPDKLADLGRFAFDVKVNFPAAIPYPSPQLQPPGQPADEGPKPDSLNPAPNLDTVRDLHSHYSEDAAAPVRSRTPEAHQMRQAPSSDTMQGPTGVRGVQGEP